jgi:hypothetical protein
MFINSYHRQKYNVRDLIKTLPGNGSVNISKYATVHEKLFLCGLRLATLEQRGYAIRFWATAR